MSVAIGFSAYTCIRSDDIGLRLAALPFCANKNRSARTGFAERFLILLFYGHGFCEISRLIHIISSLDRGVVSEELHRDDGEDRCDKGIDSRDTDGLGRVLRDFCIIDEADAEDFGAAGADFLNIAVHLRADIILGRHGDDRGFRRNEGEGAMLQFTGSVGLRMDVGDFFQLQCAFHGDRIVDGAAKVENIIRLDELFSDICHVFFFIKHGIDLIRQISQCVGDLLDECGLQCAFQLSHVESEEQERHELGGIGFRRSDSDFRTRQSIDDIVGFTRDGGTDGIRHGKALGTEAFRFFESRQGIDGFAGLADYDAERLIGRERTAVSIFGSDFYRYRDLHEAFDVVLCDEAGMVCGAAGGDQDVIDAGEAFFRPAEIVEIDGAVFIEMDLYCIMDRFGLFIDFLQHEMRVTAFFCGFRAPLDFLDFFLDRLAFGIEEGNAIFLHDGQLTVVKDINFSGMVDDSRDVGSDEILAIAKADDERIVLLRADDGVRHRLVHDDEAVGAFDHGEDFADGGEEISVIHLFEKVCYDFGVGIRLEDMAFVDQLLLERHVVFDDAIVYDDKMVVAVAMRMGIPIRRLSVRRPASMPDADVTGKRMLLQGCFQICQTAFLLFDGNRAFVIDGDTSRVIAAIFEASQPINQKAGRFAAAHITYNTTHTVFLLAYFFGMLCRSGPPLSIRAVLAHKPEEFLFLYDIKELNSIEMRTPPATIHTEFIISHVIKIRYSFMNT